MPVARKVRKVANPRKKFTRKQILAGFGGKRRKSALKSRRKRTAAPKKRTATRKRNVAKPRAVARKRTATRKPRTRSKNPPIVLTLGAVNPRKKRSTMAKRKRKTTRRRRVHRRRTVRAANPVRRRRRTYRRRNMSPPRRRRRTVRRRRTTRRNPSMFNLRGTDMVQAIFGGLVGVAAAKFIPGAIPIRIGGGNIVRVVMTGLSAVLAGWLAEKAINKTFGGAVMFGGLMQTGSVALNAFLPAVGQQIGLSGGRGVGYLQDTAGFVVPQNPVLPPAAPPPPNARMTMSGLDRAYKPAF